MSHEESIKSIQEPRDSQIKEKAQSTPAESDIPGAPNGSHGQLEEEAPVLKAAHSREFWVLLVPPRLRYNADTPFHFGLALNVVLGLVSTFTVANLYWAQPLLIEMAKDFDVSYESISQVPTLAQAGYGTGLLLITPLGDLVRRRPLLLLLVTGSTLVTIGLAITRSVHVFIGLTYVTALLSVTPQIAIPLAADLAPDDRRATAMSIVLSGLLLGIMVARVIGGLIGQFSSWRNVYYMSIGLQAATVFLLYFMLPDYPRKNKHLSYGGILWSMARFAVTEPVVISSSLIGLCASTFFAGFWVVLTFLLGSDPYNLSTVVIGLFGLIGMGAVAAAPFVGRVIDKFTPWIGALVALSLMTASSAMYAGGAGKSLAVPILVALFMDIGQQMQSTANAARIFAVNPNARARLNAIFMIMLFLGQVLGTQASSTIFLRYGWRATGGFWLGMSCLGLIIHLCRGPNLGSRQLFGYNGGFSARKKQAPKDLEHTSAKLRTSAFTPGVR